MRCGDCFIIVYSITDYKTFEEAQSIFEFTKRIRGQDAPVVRNMTTPNGPIGTECSDVGLQYPGIENTNRHGCFLRLLWCFYHSCN